MEKNPLKQGAFEGAEKANVRVVFPLCCERKGGKAEGNPLSVVKHREMQTGEKCSRRPTRHAHDQAHTMDLYK